VRPKCTDFPYLRGRVAALADGGGRTANPYLKGGRRRSAAALLVPAVDEDGNDRAGHRLPDIAVPLATYTGWNFRQARDRIAG